MARTVGTAHVPRILDYSGTVSGPWDLPQIDKLRPLLSQATAQKKKPAYHDLIKWQTTSSTGRKPPSLRA
jgi:hypothetical protein